MHKLLVLGLCLVTGNVFAKEQDPFGDADFKNAPLIYNQAHKGRGRFEVSLMYTSSLVDKFTSHQGLLVDFGYHLSENWAIAASLGYLHGGLTSIVTDPNGIIGNKLNNCDNCTNINPNLPDYNQITGLADALVIWSPLYGKINIVSELAVNMQLYLIGGAGVNGLRQITATATGDNSFKLSGGNFLDGGMFSQPKFHLTAGAGLKIFVTDWMALRSEFRALGFYDRFEFEQGKGKQGYVSAYWFAQAGVSFLF